MMRQATVLELRIQSLADMLANVPIEIAVNFEAAPLHEWTDVKPDDSQKNRNLILVDDWKQCRVPYFRDAIRVLMREIRYITTCAMVQPDGTKIEFLSLAGEPMEPEDGPVTFAEGWAKFVRAIESGRSGYTKLSFSRVLTAADQSHQMVSVEEYEPTAV